MRRALLAAVAVLACARPERDAADAVRRYDDALVRAYRRADASELAAVATADEARRVSVLVELKSAGKLVLESELRSFRADRVEVSANGSAAVVATTERWRYQDRHLAPGDAPGPTFERDMAMRYELVREGKSWKVAAVKTISSQPVPAAAGPGAPR